MVMNALYSIRSCKHCPNALSGYDDDDGDGDDDDGDDDDDDDDDGGEYGCEDVNGDMP